MSESPPVCLGPGGDLAAEHKATEMQPVDHEDGGWKCPECVVIVRV